LSCANESTESIELTAIIVVKDSCDKVQVAFFNMLSP
jgi:hypothetical protein